MAEAKFQQGDRGPPVVGRGAQITPANRFERIHAEADFEQCEHDEALAESRRTVATQFFDDATRSVICENNSPDIPFRYSINPYRGCEHGCAYCYARPGHETLGMNAGLDFETKIMVKRNAPALLREEINRPRWRGDVISISGVTDCYQPAERRFRITRGCLEVLHEARNPCGLITKNALITRDLDLLGPMAAENLVHCYVSITTLDVELARVLEPRTSSPTARLRAVAELSAAGVPVGVMVAPIIPGLNDAEMPAILAAAREAGARMAGYTLLRLPWAVEPIFLDWLLQNRPLQHDRIVARIRDTRGGKLYDATIGQRMSGQGIYAEQIDQTFRVFARKHGLDGRLPALDTSQFRPPLPASGQQRLF